MIQLFYAARQQLNVLLNCCIFATLDRMTHFNYHAIASINDPNFSETHKIYLQSFPDHEQRTLEGMEQAMMHPDFHYESILDQNHDIIGLLCFWETPHFIYLEYLATAPQKRNAGLGAQILHDLKQRSSLPIILEIDPIENIITQRRLGFYERNGFIANFQYHYIHPPYQPQHQPYPLIVMSSPAPLSENLYRTFEAYHHTTVVHPEITTKSTNNF